MENEGEGDEFVAVTDAMMKKLHLVRVGKSRLKDVLAEKFQEGVDFRWTERRAKNRPGRPTGVLFATQKCLAALRDSAEPREGGGVKNEDRRPRCWSRTTCVCRPASN
eukprot:jgi/Mesvir1/14610/Mv05280-RA.1